MDLPFALIVGTSAACFALLFLSAVVPIVNGELTFLAFVAAARGWPWTLALVVAATAGQMAGKSLMYWLGRGARYAPGERQRRVIDRWRGRFERAPRAVIFFVLLSAFTGIPPFYVVSVLAGAVRANFAAFVAAGTTGRFLRFAVLAMFPPAIVYLLRG
jgi:membrane protein YqaA with SNARE-associated domain